MGACRKVKEYNKQYNYAASTSLSVRIATKVRRQMFERFMAYFNPTMNDTVLDIGVTADQSYSSSNYFEALYPFKSQITACGLDDASFLETQYPGVKFQFGNALQLPFGDNSFDFVHSSAVWEHVGSASNQSQMLAECVRVARRGIMLITPNRWFPVEFHCQLPLLHWLPKPLFRSILKHTKYRDLADEAVLNLLSPREVRSMAENHREKWIFQVKFAHLMFYPSNILLFARKEISHDKC